MGVKDLKPSVNRRIVFFLAGIVWSIVGTVLCGYAISWLYLKERGFLLGLAGLLISLIIHRFGFSNIVKKNIDRILQMEERVCIFAFQPWKGYFMVGLMMALGGVLRSLPIPRYYLSIVYIAMGFALILSSIQYYRVFLRVSVEGG